MKCFKILLALCAVTTCLSLTSCESLLDSLNGEGINSFIPTSAEMEKHVYGKWECIKAGPHTNDDKDTNGAEHPCEDPSHDFVSYLESITFSASNVVFRFSEPVSVKSEPFTSNSYVTEFVCDMTGDPQSICNSHYLLGNESSLEYKGEFFYLPYQYLPDGESYLDYTFNWGNIALYGIYEDKVKRVDYMLFYSRESVYELKRVE